DAATRELVELTDEALRIDDHALREDARDVLAEDAARHEPHDDLLVAHDERVPRIRSPAVTDDEIRALGEDVDDLPLAFVAPLRAYDHHARHGSLLYHDAGEAPCPRVRLGGCAVLRSHRRNSSRT